MESGKWKEVCKVAANRQMAAKLGKIGKDKKRKNNKKRNKKIK